MIIPTAQSKGKYIHFFLSCFNTVFFIDAAKPETSYNTTDTKNFTEWTEYLTLHLTMHPLSQCPPPPIKATSADSQELSNHPGFQTTTLATRLYSAMLPLYVLLMQLLSPDYLSFFFLPLEEK